MRWWSMLFGVWVVSACGPPIPDSEAGSGPASFSVSFQPTTDSAHVFAVTHVQVSGANLAGPWFLFQGPVSSYYLGKLKQGDTPSALAARRISMLSYRKLAETVVAPLQALEPSSYSLVAASGIVAEFQVASSLPLLNRLWPPPELPGSLQFAIYCAETVDRALPSTPGALSFEPGQISVTVSAGIDAAGLFGDRCLQFSSGALLAADELVVAPPVHEGWALSPALFSGADLKDSGVEPASALSCRAEEVAFGPGCAQPADDRVLVRTPPGALLWIVHSERGALAQVTAQGLPLTVSGLDPDRAVHLWGETRDLSGAQRSFDVVLHTQLARERLVLNEVLADALGPEPQSEWLEIVNDGTLAADLGSYSLQDGGGRTALPHALLSAKEYALLVREDYVPDPADEAPPPSARLIRVPTLGRSGLANAGERLSLLDRAGVERSVLPALKGLPGQSLARRAPSSADDDANSFSFGVPSPGFANASNRAQMP